MPFVAYRLALLSVYRNISRLMSLAVAGRVVVGNRQGILSMGPVLASAVILGHGEGQDRGISQMGGNHRKRQSYRYRTFLFDSSIFHMSLEFSTT